MPVSRFQDATQWPDDSGRDPLAEGRRISRSRNGVPRAGHGRWHSAAAPLPNHSFDRKPLVPEPRSRVTSASRAPVPRIRPAPARSWSAESPNSPSPDTRTPVRRPADRGTGSNGRESRRRGEHLARPNPRGAPRAGNRTAPRQLLPPPRSPPLPADPTRALPSSNRSPVRRGRAAAYERAGRAET